MGSAALSEGQDAIALAELQIWRARPAYLPDSAAPPTRKSKSSTGAFLQLFQAWEPRRCWSFGFVCRYPYNRC